MLYSTLVEIKVEVGVELGNTISLHLLFVLKQHYELKAHFISKVPFFCFHLIAFYVGYVVVYSIFFVGAVL